MKPIGEDRWLLVIATPAVDDQGSTEAYRQVYRALGLIGDVSITSSDIKLIGAKHRDAKESLNLQKRVTAWVPAFYLPATLGGIPVEKMYVYPLGKVEIPVYGLYYPGGPTTALHLSLVEQREDSKLRVQRAGEWVEYSAKTGTYCIVGAPEGATLVRDEVWGTALAWDRQGVREKSSPNEVLAFAQLGLHGFRLLQEPSFQHFRPFETIDSPHGRTGESADDQRP